MASPFQRLKNTVRDVFDANTEADRQKRLKAGQAELYQDQQRAMGNNRPNQNIAQAVFSNTLRAVNTGAKMNVDTYPRAIAGLSLMGANRAGLLSNDTYNKKINSILADDKVYGGYKSTGGLFNAGTLIDSPTQAKNLKGGDIARKSLAYGAGTYGELSPIGVRGGIVKRAGIGALESVIGDAGSQVANNGRYDYKQGAQSALFGAAMPFAGDAASKVGGRVAKNVIDRPTSQDVSNLLAFKNSRGGFTDDAVYAQRLNSIKKFGLDPTSPTVWRDIDNIIAEVDRQYAKLSEARASGQAGFAGITDPEMGKILNEAKQKQQLPQAETAAPMVAPQAKSVAQAQPSDIAIKTDGTLIGQNDGIAKPPQNDITIVKAGKQTRYASKTVPESEFVSEQVRKSVRENAPTYEVQNERQRYTSSLGRIKEQGIDNFTNDLKQRLEVKNGTIDAQTVADGQSAAAMLDAQGDPASLQKATEIYERLSEHLTAAGQTIQAASILSRRTPDGLQYGAIKTLREAGVDVTPKLQTELKRLIDGVRQNPNDQQARFKVAKFVEKNTPSSIASKLVTIWKAGLLTSPRTTAGNIAANTAETIFAKGYVDPLATAIDSVMSIFTGKRSRSLTGRGLASGTGEGIVKGVDYFKTGYDARNPLKKFDVRAVHFSDSPAGKAAELYTQGVFRLMGAQDQPFYYANFRNSLYDQAITEAHNLKLRGGDKSAYIKKFITEPSTQALELADKEARYATFQNDTKLGEIAGSVKSKSGAIGDFVMPFTGVPSSVATRMVERTPIGTALEIVSQIRSKNFDQRALTKAIANGSAVIPLAGVGYALAMNGQMTLGYPQDEKERKLWEAEGKQPYSIKVGDTWLSTNYFQPAGNLMAAGAEYAGKIKEGKSPQEAFNTSIAGAGKALSEQSFLQGVSGVISAVNDPSQFGQKFAEQTAGSIVPNFVRTAARATDEYARDINGVGDSFKAGIPILRQTLDVKRDMFGEPIKRRSDPLNETINPFRPSDVQNQEDKTYQEIRRLKDAKEAIVPTEATKSSFKNMNDRQLNEINRQIGSTVKKEWDWVVSDERYAILNDADKKKVLDKANDTVYQAVKYLTLGEGNINSLTQRFLSGEAIDWLEPQGKQVKVYKTRRSGGGRARRTVSRGRRKLSTVGIVAATKMASPSKKKVSVDKSRILEKSKVQIKKSR